MTGKGRTKDQRVVKVWILVVGLLFGLVVPSQATVPEFLPAQPEPGSKVDDSRHRCEYPVEAIRSLIPEGETIRAVPRQTSVMKRVLGRDGTVRVETFGLLQTHRGNRVRFLEIMDFEKCEGVKEVALLRPRGRKESLVMRTTIRKCSDTMEEWWSAFAEAAEMGPAAVKEFAAVGPVTIETSSLRAVLSLEEWERDGHEEIAESLSPEFREVLEEEVIPVARVYSVAEWACRLLGGLLDENCPEESGVAACLAGPTDCEFDAEFDVPCTPAQQRTFEDRRRGGELVGR